MPAETRKGRLAIIAGGGNLPLHVARAAREQGENPFIFALSGESTSDWRDFDYVDIALGDIRRFRQIAEESNVDRIVMSGSVSRRPPIREVKLGITGLIKIPSIIRKLTGGGDNTVLTAVIGLLEDEKRKVIGVQEVAPGLLVATGPLGRVSPDTNAVHDINCAVRAARLIGSLDFGQGAIAVGGRVVALEGPEGTDAMMSRVADMRSAGRISRKKKGVLVKLCKTEQDRRVDLPSAGPATIRNAHAAGLAGIALEAGRSLLLDIEDVLDYADSNGLFVYGLEPGVKGDDH